jgi:drug/metabolite transporter (DMT)-like permease
VSENPTTGVPAVDTSGQAAPGAGDAGAADGKSASVGLPMAVALAVMVVWGGTPLFTKVAAAQIDPILVGVLRTVIAGVLAVPLVLIWRQPLPATSRDRWVLAFSGFAAFVAFPLLFGLGQHETSAIHGALILATLPVFTSLFGTLLERRPISAKWAVGCSIALAGEALIIVWRSAGAASISSVRGDVIILLSALICSMGYVAGAHLAQGGYPSLSTTLWGVGLGAVVVLPILVWSVAESGWPQADAAAWSSVLVLAILTSIVGYIAWYWALARGGISRIAGVQFTQPLFGLVLAAFVLGEELAPVTAVAAVCILAGAWLVQRAASG